MASIIDPTTTSPRSRLDVRFPTWPRQVKIDPGEIEQVVVPVVVAKRILGSLRWRGAPIDLTIKQPDNTVVATFQELQPPSADISWEPSLDDDRSNAFWTLEFSVRGDMPTIGELHLELPPIAPQLLPRLKEQIAAIDRAKIKEIEDLLKWYHEPPTESPYIESVTPEHGLPGETITIRCQHLGLLLDSTEVWFVVNQIPVSGNILDVNAISSDSYDITVIVPTITMLTQPTLGSIYLRRLFPNPADSAPRPFTFDPELPPKLDAVYSTPLAEGDLATIEGQHFGEGTTGLTVACWISGGYHDAQIVSRSDTRIIFRVPSYEASGVYYGHIKVRRTYPARDVESAIDAAFCSSEVIVQWYNTHGGSATNALGPGASVEIYGQGFGPTSGSVRLEIPPGQVLSGGGSWELPILFWSETKITAAFPAQIGPFLPCDARFCVEPSVLRAGRKHTSQWQTIHVVPRLTSQFLTFQESDVEANQPTVWTGGQPGDRWEDNTTGTGIIVTHEAGFFDGHKGNDDFFRATTLQNSYIVEQVLFKKLAPAQGEGDAYITESYIGSDNPHVRVHWWNSPIYDHVIYELIVKVRGPEGYNPR